MAKIELIRTTAFRLADEHFGKVYVYRPGMLFSRAWEQLEKHWQNTGDTGDFKRLPYRGLATALRVLSGDFVALQRSIAGDRAFVISRKPIGLEQLKMALSAWESRALGMHDGPITRVLHDLTCEQVEVVDHVHRRPGLCPTFSEGSNWVWDVGIWEIAHRLAGSALETDAGNVRLRLDSDAALLTWDHVVRPQKDATAGAMHKVVLNLITVPGVEGPVLSMQSSLVRLAPAWKETRGARYAWAELAEGAPILRGKVRTRRTEAGRFETVWDDRAAEVIRGVSLDPLPGTANEPSLTGPLRTGYAKQPLSHKIGRGVGPWFHECIAHHARKVLGVSVQPVDLATTTVPRGWKERAERVSLVFGNADSAVKLRVFVVYSDSEVRRRVRDALAFVLLDGAHSHDLAELEAFAGRLNTVNDDEPVRSGPLEVQFVRPQDAENWLLQRNEKGAIERWAGLRLPIERNSGIVTAAIVETDESAGAGRDALADPKQVLRAALAGKGIVTQFITYASAPSDKSKDKEEEVEKFRDHAAANAVGDLFRSSGFFLRPFPEFGGGAESIVVGVYGARLTGQTTGKGTSYVVNLVAVCLGTRKAWGYTHPKGWVPIDEATAWFLSSDHTLSEVQAKQRVESAIGQIPLVFDGKPPILLFDACGCRRFWACLADKSEGKPEAWMQRSGAAVVRVRTATSEVLRPAGAGEWNAGFVPAKHTDFRLMSIIGGAGNTPTFVLSGSAVMSREISARSSTRLAADTRALKKDWHSLGTTELLVLEAGQWEPQNIIQQVALLCRVAPTWDRTLRWPSPLHLARAIVRDHPHAFFADGEEEEAEDSRQLRLDLGFGW